MKKTINKLQKQKGAEKLTAITAYDALFAKLFDPLIDIILVGDSLNMSFNNQKDTLSLDLNAILYHARAVSTVVENAYLIVDMPFGSYFDALEAVKSAIKIYKTTKADAVKLEGGIEKLPIIKALISEGIAVTGHIGLMPQSARGVGGYKVAGKDTISINYLKESAHALEEAGVDLLVLEAIKSETSALITSSISIPTIGIGSGAEVDGQILVFSDMLGLFTDFSPKFVRRYLEGATLVSDAIKSYINDVKSKNFPNQNEWY